MKGRSTLVIAHRLSTIQHAAMIVVLDDGRVVEQGSLDHLLAQRGIFYELWQAQKFY
jgi:ABC-type multidrug transport system fused ATPase/permease subunit